MTALTNPAQIGVPRKWPRYSNLKDLYLSYEGRSEFFPIRPPDISPTGMFINTAADFPEGAILKVSFRLTKSNYPISVRCEVRYCLSGVGIGVEFIGMPPTDQHAIAIETRAPITSFKLPPTTRTRTRQAPRKKHRPTTRAKKLIVRRKKR